MMVVGGLCGFVVVVFRGNRRRCGGWCFVALAFGTGGLGGGWW
jgi:hypothetical protein